MSNELTTRHHQQLAQFGEMGVQAIVDRKRKLVEVMRAVMTEGEHFGRIPGCGDKPTLYKAGAEVLATTFGLAPTFKITRTDLANGHREYEIVCTLVHIATGVIVGEGVGTCSTMESKYRWRTGGRSCPECGKSGTLLKSKQKPEWFCWAKKGGCGGVWPLNSDVGREIGEQNTDRVENPDVADTYNTVLKMAKKRAQVDCTLTAVGASDILTQDLEDLPAGSDGWGPPRDNVPDAEFHDQPRRTVLDDIDAAPSLEALEALVPTLMKLDDATKAKAKTRYGARRAKLRQSIPTVGGEVAS